MRLIQFTPKRFEDSLKGRKPVLQSIVPLTQWKKRDWGSLSEEDMIAHGIWKLGHERIRGRGELAKADTGLYQALRKRKLLNEIGIREIRRDWAGMERKELIAHAKAFIEERGITSRKELERADTGLYGALMSRKLQDDMGLGKKIRNWSRIKNGEIVAYAKGFIAERGITGKMELERKDRGLYQALRRRELLDEVGFQDKRRNWVCMERNELIARAREFIAERGIGGRGELARADAGLYRALRTRNLLDEVGLANKYMDWSRVGWGKLVAHAKAFIAERGITRRGELEKANSTMYNALWRRELLDAVFSEVESSNHKEAVDGVLSALESFGDGE